MRYMLSGLIAALVTLIAPVGTAVAVEMRNARMRDQLLADLHD